MKLTQSNDTMTVVIPGRSSIGLGIGITLAGILVSAFLWTGTTTTHGAQSPKWLVLFGLAFVGAGLSTFFRATGTTCSLQKNGLTVITATRLIGGRQTQQSFATATITAIQLVIKDDRSNRTQAELQSKDRSVDYRTSTLKLGLQNGQSVYIDSSSGGAGLSVQGQSLGRLLGGTPLQSEAEQLAAFLHVPLHTLDAGTLAGGAMTLEEFAKLDS